MMLDTMKLCYIRGKPNEREIMASTLEATLDKSAVYTGNGLTAIYQPVNYQNEHGTVVAHIIEYSGDEITTSLYYSRGWAYWNFQDIFGDDFAIANNAMGQEALDNQIDYEIGIKTEAVEAISNDTIPHANPYWQSLVVRTAYDAITNVEEFANICRTGNKTQEEVQRMIDIAVGAVLSNPRFSIAGFSTQTA